MGRSAERQAGLDLAYVLVRSARRTLCLRLLPDNTLEVRCPKRLPSEQVERFVQSRAGWVARKRIENSQAVPIRPFGPAQAEQAQRMLVGRLNALLDRHSLPRPQHVVIRDLSSRWGSCSRSGRVSLNCRCGQLPPELIDYVILHELCHLLHLNHGSSFWQSLEQHLPDARIRRRALSGYRLQPRRQKGLDPV
jgi:hypothetical protein